jgi:gliding motility-associated-like protein
MLMYSPPFFCRKIKHDSFKQGISPYFILFKELARFLYRIKDFYCLGFIDSKAFKRMLKLMTIFANYFKTSNFSTMRKYFILFLLSFAGTFSMNGQLVVEFSEGSADPGAQLEVDVMVSDFDNLFGIQFSINWDSLVYKYADIINVTTSLPGFDQNAIGIPPGTVNVDEGELTVSWFQSNTHSLPDGAVLFSVVLTAQDLPCDSTEITVSEMPLAVEITDENFNDIGISSEPGTIFVNGMDCNGGTMGDDDLTFTVNNQVVESGQNICVPIVMENFDGFNAGMGKLGWDPDVLSFTGIQNTIPGSFNDNQTMVSNGMYNFIWENLDPANPVNFPDGTILFEICFDAVGNVGDMTDIDMEEFMSEWGFTDASGAEPPMVLNNGKVTIVDQPSDPVILTISDVSINQNGNGCVSVSVENFIDINSFQGTFAWNDGVIDFTQTQDFGALNALDAGDFNQTMDNNLRLTWNAPGGGSETLPDGTVLFEICFDGIGDCDNVSLVDFIDVDELDIEFNQIIGGSPVTIGHEINAGSAMIFCEMGDPTCEITGTFDILCNGDNTGAIQVEVTDAENCDCVWFKDGSTTPFMTQSAPDCNLMNVGAGMYRLDIVCDGEVACTSDTIINQPSAIIINGMITNIGCGQTTGIIVLEVNGGASNYSYQWDDVNMSQTKDLSGLEAGDYTVVVTDANNCIAMRTFTISDISAPLAFEETVNNVACFGESTGSISLNISGGCPDGNGNYEISPANLSNLPAGTYTVTVSDFSNPPLISTKMVTISQPDAALEVSGSTTPSTGNNGSINITPEGGTMPYTITWSGGIAMGETNPTGLAPDTYTVTIVDVNGCTISEAFIVTEATGDPEMTDPDANDAICNGEASGAVSFTITAGTGPFSIQLIDDNSNVVETTTTDIPGPVTIPGVEAGTYTVLVTDANGNDNSKTVVVSEPTAIAIESNINCANGSNNDGSIEIEVSGGVGSYLFEWSNGSVSENLENIGVGNYSLLVEDGNGCQAIINNLRVTDCNPTNCYEAIHIITPNGDGINDFFVINCVMQENTKLTVFDRWGQEVYTQQNYDNSWSGLDMENEALEESAYMWVLEVEFAESRREVFTGTVTILRQE